MSAARKKKPQQRANAAEASHVSPTPAANDNMPVDDAQSNSEPVLEVSDGQQAVVRINDVLLPFSVEGDEPLIRDEDYARWLGFSRPRDIRALIRGMISSKKLNGVAVRGVAPRTSGGRPGQEFWLTKTQALLVATQSNTQRAWEMTEHIVRVFEVVTRKTETTVLSREVAEREFLTSESRARELSKLARLAAEALAPFSRSSVEQLTMMAIEGAKGVVCFGGTGRELAHTSMDQFWSMRSALMGFMRFAATLPKPKRTRKKPVIDERLTPPMLPLSTTLDLPTMTVRLSLEPKAKSEVSQ